MKCCICGTVRNCGQYLDKIFQNMEQIGSLFENYVIILYYDESFDDTLEKMKNYQKQNNKLYFYVNKSPLLEYRTHRLALGRNYCINTIRENFRDYQYFIMMDCDDICARDIKVKLLNNYLHRGDWDALSFNHPSENYKYYDSWALAKRPYVLSCHHFKDPAQVQRLISHIIKQTQHNKLIDCLSAFNGFSIYKTDKFINCYYDGRFRIDYIPKNLIKENIKHSANIINGLKEDCEHRHFHIQAVLENNARIRISPRCLFM